MSDTLSHLTPPVARYGPTPPATRILAARGPVWRITTPTVPVTRRSVTVHHDPALELVLSADRGGLTAPWVDDAARVEIEGPDASLAEIWLWYRHDSCVPGGATAVELREGDQQPPIPLPVSASGPGEHRVTVEVFNEYAPFGWSDLWLVATPRHDWGSTRGPASTLPLAS
ncbi:MAG: hypothetical protein ACE5GB_09020 [Acidimicrobiales bacterium]